MAAFSDPTRVFLARTMAWRYDDGAFCTITYTVIDAVSGRTFWRNRGFRTLDDAVDFVAWVQRQPTTADLYVAMSSQRDGVEKVIGKGRKITEVNRSKCGAVGHKCLFVDIDVKPEAYATTEDAGRGLAKFLADTGLPRPTLLVASGSGGLHAHWVLSEILSTEQWKPLADALATAAKTHGFLIDGQCTVDAARVLRVPGTKNFKWNPPRDVRLGSSIVPNDYPVEFIAAKLAPYAARQRVATAVVGSDELAGGIEAASFVMADFVSAVGFVAGLKSSPWLRTVDGGKGYESWRVVVFACAYIIAAGFGHDDAVRALFSDIVKTLSRDPEKNASLLEQEVRATSGRLARGGDLVRPASVFKLATDLGWKPPAAPAGAGATYQPTQALNHAQAHALRQHKSAIRDAITVGSLSGPAMAQSRAGGIVRRLQQAGTDPQVLAGLAGTLALHAIRGGVGPADTTDLCVLLGLSLESARSTVNWASREAAKQGDAA